MFLVENTDMEPNNCGRSDHVCYNRDSKYCPEMSECRTIDSVFSHISRLLITHQ